MAVTLREYQPDLLAQGIKILDAYWLVYYILEMRLGKTFISLFTANHYNPEKVLFVTRKKSIKNIENDFIETGFTWDLKVINYEQLGKELPEYDIYIFDEAHKLGTYPLPNIAARQARKLTRGKRCIFLSGTPTPETETQIYNQLRVSRFSCFEKDWNFLNWASKYVDIYTSKIPMFDPKTKKKYDREITKYDRAKKELIFERCEKYFVRHSQKDAGFKHHEIHEKFLYVPMTKWQKEIREDIKYKKAFHSIHGWKIEALSGASMQQKIHQIDSGTCILSNDIPESEAIQKKEYKILCTTKAEYIKEQFKGKKIAIFYQFQAERIAIASVFGKDKITDNQFDFEANDNLTFVGQNRSCREGIDLKWADCLVFYNISFSALDYWQARNRIQSFDRADPPVVYFIFTEGGIEKKVFDAVMAKKNYTLQYFKKDFYQKEQMQLF
jgi:hypothetical protein